MQMRCRLACLFVAGASLAPFAAARAGDEKLPTSTGEYQIRLDGERIGEEQFRVFKDKRVVLEATRMIYWPEPSRRELRFEMERSLEPRKLELTSTRGGVVTELELEGKGQNWRVEVEGQGRKKKRHELGRRAGTVVDFDSLLFNALAVRQLKLATGEERTVDAVALQLPDLAGQRVQQTYRRVDGETLETEFAGAVETAVYELEHSEATHRLWVDANGVVLKGVFDRPGGEVGIVLVRLKTAPGAWP